MSHNFGSSYYGRLILKSLLRRKLIILAFVLFYLANSLSLSPAAKLTD
jgi:hypothetical protein